MFICLDPGHSGPVEPGACFHNLHEADLTLAIALQAAEALRQNGASVCLTRTGDTDDDGLTWRAALANRAGCNAFLSIHCNAAEAEEANGTETWACAGSYRGSMLASCIQNQIVDALDTKDRGVKIATPGINGLYVLTNTDMPAILVELAFISNPGDEEILANAQDALARSIARGVTDYEQLILGGK